MAVLYNEKSLGLSEDFRTPCGHILYDTSAASQVLEQIGDYKQQLHDKCNLITEGRFTGLAALHDEGALDDCIRQGNWRSELQQLLPVVTDSPNSHGVVGTWPYLAKGQSNNGRVGHMAPSAAVDWSNLNFIHGRWWDKEHTYVRAGPWDRGRRRSRKGHRGGAKRRRGIFSARDKTNISVYFCNLTSWSQHASEYVSNLGDDILLVAETHADMAKSKAMLADMGRRGWKGTASVAKPSTVHESGTSAGVACFTKLRVDSRPLSCCTDHDGKFTPNPLLSGRWTVIDKVDVLTGSLYLEGKLKFTAGKFLALSDLEHITRGGDCPFIVGLDGNMDKSAWDTFMWGSKVFLTHMACEVIGVSDQDITCRGATNSDGGTRID